MCMSNNMFMKCIIIINGLLSYKGFEAIGQGQAIGHFVFGALRAESHLLPTQHWER